MEKKVRDIRKPEFMKKAIQSRSHNAALEVLIALAVFFVGNMVISVIQVPAMMGYLLSSKEYISMVQSSTFDMQAIMETTMKLILNLPDWILIVTLLSEIGLIAVFILYCWFFEKRKADTMGFRKKGFIPEYLRGIGIGIAAFIAAYLICLITGSLEFHSVSSEGFTVLYLIGFLIGYLIQGMAEEVICRGYLFVSLTKRYSVTISMIISALFFTLLHGMNTGMSFLSYINLFLFGIFMALLFVRYENIWVVGAFHGIWNFVQGNIFGVQVSGLKLQRSLFTSTFVENRGIINGGSFGLEGGLAVTVVMGVLIALLLWSMSKKGYIVEEEPVNNPYDKIIYSTTPYQNNPYNQNPPYGQNQPYQNPSSHQEVNQQNEVSNQNEKPSQQDVAIEHGAGQFVDTQDSGKTQTGFDQSYFKN